MDRIHEVTRQRSDNGFVDIVRVGAADDLEVRVAAIGEEARHGERM